MVLAGLAIFLVIVFVFCMGQKSDNPDALLGILGSIAGLVVIGLAMMIG